MTDRSFIGEQLAKLGVSSVEIDAMTETVLYDNAEPVAHLYHAGGLVALWNLEDQTVHIYDRHAHILYTGEVP